MIKLGVNIDHVATIREARKGKEPDPVWAGALAELAGADIITIHLREDRRHIHDRDLRLLKETVQTKLNLEMADTEEIVGIALEVHPEQVTLVPEKREEVTTEGGLDVRGNLSSLQESVKRFREAGILVSFFIDPVEDQLQASREAGVQFVELHTGSYANAVGEEAVSKELEKLMAAARRGGEMGLRINAGHGLNYLNVKPILSLPHLEELHIGHSIISRAVFVGLDRAIREMSSLIFAEQK
ncbi:MAG: pyridoxine 5'-phosphate synthase [Candidatus Auribacterota bacterium]|nr:pyridoxine 5'-phosphate synthase [Candidatus Auribacterota bacterium]